MFSFGIILLTVVSFTNAQWRQDMFTTAENQLRSIVQNGQTLLDFIYQERQKHGGGNMTGGSLMSHNVAYSSFINDVETRLADMEQATQELVRIMRTCPDAPLAPPPPTNVIVESTTIDNVSSIVVKWDPPFNPPENMQYKVYFVPVDQNGLQTAGEVVFRICDSTQTIASITDLTPRSRYRIRVGAVAGAVAEGASMPLNVKTPDIIPSRVRNVMVKSSTANTITLMWNPPPVMGDLMSYEIYYEENPVNKIHITVKPPKNMYVIKDLTEGTSYKIQVSAKSDNGEGEKSIPIEGSTQRFIPGAPQAFKGDAINKTAVVVRWAPPPPKPGDGIIRGYLINYTDVRYTDVAEHRVGADVFETVISNLTPAQVYYFRAFAFTHKSVGRGGPVIALETLADVPSPPRQLQIMTIREEPPKIALTWLPPLHTYGNLKNYTLVWGVQNGANRTEYISKTRLEWSSDFLDDDTTHVFRLSAVNKVGLGDAAVTTYMTPKKVPIIPPNVKVARLQLQSNGSTILNVTWSSPPVSVDGFRILFRKFQLVYSGRWELVEIFDPEARNVEIPLVEPDYPYIVVVRGIPKGQIMNMYNTHQNHNMNPGLHGMGPPPL